MRHTELNKMVQFWEMVVLFSCANLLRVSFSVMRRKRVIMILMLKVKLTTTVTRKL